MNEITMILEELKAIREEIKEMKKEMKEESKGIRENLKEVRQICRGIEEKSQFWGAIKERVDIISYNNENLQFDINKNFVRKDNIVQELKKAL